MSRNILVILRSGERKELRTLSLWDGALRCTLQWLWHRKLWLSLWVLWTMKLWGVLHHLSRIRKIRGWLRNKVSKIPKAGIGRRAISKRSIAGKLISWDLSFWLITKWVAMKFIAFISYMAYKTTVCANRPLHLCTPPFSSLINMISPLIILISTTLIALMALISLRIGMSHIHSCWFKDHLSNMSYLSSLLLL